MNCCTRKIHVLRLVQPLGKQPISNGGLANELWVRFKFALVLTANTAQFTALLQETGTTEFRGIRRRSEEI